MWSQFESRARLFGQQGRQEFFEAVKNDTEIQSVDIFLVLKAPGCTFGLLWDTCQLKWDIQVTAWAAWAQMFIPFNRPMVIWVSMPMDTATTLWTFQQNAHIYHDLCRTSMVACLSASKLMVSSR